MNSIKIAIADDYPIYREGLKIGLQQDQQMKVVLEAGNGSELLKALDTGLQGLPDVILMDLKMPVMDGIEATKAIRRKFESIKILAITMYDDNDRFIIHLIESGANGYLVKNAEPEEVIKAIYAVHKNGYYFNDIVNMALVKKIALKGNFKPSFDQQIEFSERELEVLKLICNENTAVEIGSQLFLSPRSVEGIRQRLIDKIGVRNTAGLVVFAVKNGLIE